MTELIKEKVYTQAKIEATDSQTASYLVYFIFGALEILLGFRLIFKLMGASTGSGFVRMIYSLSNLLIMPFEGIFRRATTQGIETTSVFEPATIVAMIVYAVLVVGILKLVRISSKEDLSGE